MSRPNHEKPKYGFRLSKDIIIYREAKCFLSYFNYYQCSDEILKQEIADFMEDIKISIEKHTPQRATVVSVINDAQSKNGIRAIDTLNITNREINSLIISKNSYRIQNDTMVKGKSRRRFTPSKGRKIKSMRIKKVIFDII